MKRVFGQGYIDLGTWCSVEEVAASLRERWPRPFLYVCLLLCLHFSSYCLVYLGWSCVNLPLYPQTGETQRPEHASITGQNGRLAATHHDTREVWVLDPTKGDRLRLCIRFLDLGWILYLFRKWGVAGSCAGQVDVLQKPK
jgi:hypothetical protein